MQPLNLLRSSTHSAFSTCCLRQRGNCFLPCQRQRPYLLDVVHPKPCEFEEMLSQRCRSPPGSTPPFTLGSPQSIARVMLSACDVDYVRSPAAKPLRWLSWLFLFSPQVVSDFSTLHRIQHARLPCPSPSPGVCSNSCPLSW